jgi:hypothetical protein
MAFTPAIMSGIKKRDAQMAMISRLWLVSAFIYSGCLSSRWRFEINWGRLSANLLSGAAMAREEAVLLQSDVCRESARPANPQGSLLYWPESTIKNRKSFIELPAIF